MNTPRTKTRTIVAGSLNFWEVSHGKGAPDSIIRKADKLISLGHDIPDAAHLCMALIPETPTKLFFIEADDV